MPQDRTGIRPWSSDLPSTAVKSVRQLWISGSKPEKGCDRRSTADSWRPDAQSASHPTAWYFETVFDAFVDEQADLRDKVLRGLARYVFIDADGTMGEWLVLVVKHATGIVYGTQCGGVACDLRLVEGYLVPLSLTAFDRRVEPAAFREPFHRGKTCLWQHEGELPEPKRVERLRALVAGVGVWRTQLEGEDERGHLLLDEVRLSELVEAWIPVLAPDGPGVLLTQNCD